MFPPTLHIPSRSAYHLCRSPFIFNVFLATAPSGNEVFLFTFCPIFLLTFLSDWTMYESPACPSFFTFHQIHLNQELFQPQWTEPKQQTLTTTTRSSLRHGLASVFCYFPGEHLAPSSKYKTKVDPSPRYPKTSNQMTSRKTSSAELRSEESPHFSNFEPLICAGRQ